MFVIPLDNHTRILVNHWSDCSFQILHTCYIVVRIAIVCIKNYILLDILQVKNLLALIFSDVAIIKFLPCWLHFPGFSDVP